MKRLTATRAAIYLLMIILVSPLAGCVGEQESDTASSSAPADRASAEAIKPIESGTAPIEVLTQSMRAQNAARSFRVSINSIAPNIQGEAIFEYVAPDRIRMSSPVSEMIAVGSEAYSREPRGEWQKASVDASEIAATFRDPKLLDQLTANFDIAFVGPDTIDGAPMMVFEYTPKATSPYSRAGKTRIWIGAQDSLPRKMETQTLSNRSVTTIIYSDYNSDIKIELPK